MEKNGVIHVGCCGFPVSRARYYDTFGAVEIQQTFYQAPRLETARRWRAEAPAAFVFSLKAWQLVTHESSSPTYRRLKIEIPLKKQKHYGFFKPTEEVFQAWEATRRFANDLGADLIVFQSPASFAPAETNKKNMIRFFGSLKRDGLTLIWEPRGVWKKDEEIRSLCEELGLIHCVDPLKARPLHGPLRYYRLHGPSGYGSRYGAKELGQILLMSQGESYCFFNNRFMFEDGMEFLRLAKTEERCNASVRAERSG